MKRLVMKTNYSIHVPTALSASINFHVTPLDTVLSVLRVEPR